MNDTDLNKLTSILNRLDVPDQRRNPFGSVNGSPNLPWLLRNLGINNSSLPETAEAIKLLEKLLHEGS